MIGVQGVAHPADEQRDIRALAAPVRVELVEHQEAQALRRANGVFLVLVQPEFPANTAFGLVLVLPEDSPTLLVENTLIYESFNSAARLERRIELY